MRLSPKEVDQLILALNPFLTGKKAELFLFGSRTKDHLKGGDIDLLLVADSDALKNALKKLKTKILVAFEKLMGERKIDLKITSRAETSRDPFVQTILPSAIPLKKWGRLAHAPP